MTNTMLTAMNHSTTTMFGKEGVQMDAWTELTQAAIRDRIREREVEAAGERLASISRSAAVLTAAVRTIVDARRLVIWTEPAGVDTSVAQAAAECAECPTTVSSAA